MSAAYSIESPYIHASFDTPPVSTAVMLEVVNDEAKTTEPTTEDLTNLEVEVSDEPVEPVFNGQLHSELVASQDTLKAYLAQIGKTALLDREQEVQLTKKIEAGLHAAYLLDQGKTSELASNQELMIIAREGTAARTGLIQANLRLVVSVAKKYVGRGVEFLDLIDEGNIGLIRAVEKYDYTRGFKFSTYATFWIKQCVVLATADKGRLIRLPVLQYEKVHAFNKANERLFNTLGHAPSNQELAVELDMSTEKVKKLRAIAPQPVSLQLPTGNDNNGELQDSVQDDQNLNVESYIEFSALRTTLETMLASKQFDDRERIIIKMRHGLLDGQIHTLDQVGAQIGRTRERVRQIEKKAMSKLQHIATINGLEEFLDGEY